MGVANFNPIFTLTPHIGFNNLDGDGGAAGPLKTANANMDGSGTLLTLFTAGANGSFLAEVRARAAGGNVATVLRIFVNDGAGAGVGHTVVVTELPMPATTANNAAAQPDFVKSLGFPIQAGYKVMVTLGTTIVAGVFCSLIAGDY